MTLCSHISDSVCGDCTVYTQYCLEPTGNWRGCPATPARFCVSLGVHRSCIRWFLVHVHNSAHAHTQRTHTHFAQGQARVCVRGRRRVSPACLRLYKTLTQKDAQPPLLYPHHTTPRCRTRPDPRTVRLPQAGPVSTLGPPPARVSSSHPRLVPACLALALATAQCVHPPPPRQPRQPSSSHPPSPPPHPPTRTRGPPPSPSHTRASFETDTAPKAAAR